MPSTTFRSRFRVTSRMVAVVAVLAVVALVAVALEVVVFAVVAYSVLAAAETFLRPVVADPATRVTLAVCVCALVGLAALSVYRGARGDPVDADGTALVRLYASGAVVIASLFVTYRAIVRSGLPRWTFVLVLVVLIASAYPLALLAVARDREEGGGWSATDFDADADDVAHGSVGWIAVARVVTLETARTLRAAADRLGLVGSAVVVAAAAGGLVGVSVLAGAYRWATLLPAFAWAGGAVTAGFHLVVTARDELSSAAVLDDLEAVADAVDDERLRTLERRVARLAAQADVPAPDVRLAESPTPTAAAVGYLPSRSTLVVSTGLVDALDEAQLDAVLAHELSHVANYDAAVLTALSFPRARAHRVFRRYGLNPVVTLFAGFVAAISRVCTAVVARAREYAADDGAAAMTGDPVALATALETLDAELRHRPDRDLRASSAAAFSIVPPPWEEHRFFDRTRRLIYRRLLGTHPPTERRIERLRTAMDDRERR
ncbi:M48 family metalloprotease [Halosimplex litoreum]|uniref:M48 family metalloprotease n=1 Tax=Halosimplex litoreum TaxID=1198301 RepID=A0A7T3G0J3_9EURY|nr:M48 family metallopeptidase [Halosimplex litoreum]QPV64098.1 M48 family metalloprotease [Halosimplex litoreum]